MSYNAEHTSKSESYTKKVTWNNLSGFKCYTKKLIYLINFSTTNNLDLEDRRGCLIYIHDFFFCENKIDFSKKNLRFRVKRCFQKILTKSVTLPEFHIFRFKKLSDHNHWAGIFIINYLNNFLPIHRRALALIDIFVGYYTKLVFFKGLGKMVKYMFHFKFDLL